MGPPPLDFLQRSEKSKLLGPRRYIYSSSLTWIQLTDYIGTWKSDVPILEIDLSGQESRLQGREKASYLAFLRKMLQWKPEDRKSIRDIMADEWLLADLIESGEVVRQ